MAKFRSSDNTPHLPVSKGFDMHTCAEIVDRGMRLFIDAAPPEGWRWMRRLATITFDPTGGGSDNISSDAARYMLPLHFSGEGRGKITYTASTGHTGPIEWVDESAIRLLRAGTVTTGYPLRAAILPYSPTSPTLVSNRRWEIIFDPQPSAVQTVTFPYLLSFDGVQIVGGVADSASATTVVDASITMYPDDYFIGWVAEIIDGTGRGSYATVTDYAGATGTVTVADWLDIEGTAGGTDPAASSKFILKPCHPYYHPAGFSFDGVVESACLAACEMYGEDQIFDEHNIEYFHKVKLPEAYGINRRQTPRRLGKVTNGPRIPRERTWSTVTTDHDI